MVKRAVRQYCFDVKPFNFNSLFYYECDVRCYDYAHQIGGPWTAVHNNVQALVTFSWYTTSVLIGKSFICDKVQWTKQNICICAAMGLHWRS